MIELAPQHKRGLTLDHPTLLGPGFAGYALEYAGLLDLSRVGALATLPTTLRPRLGSRRPRLFEMPAGVLLSRGGTNPGLASVLHSNRHQWKKLDRPILLTLAAEGFSEWPALVRRVGRAPAIHGLEVELAEEMDPEAAVYVVRQSSDLPLLARLPVTRAVEMAEAAARGGADALVVGLPPRADYVSLSLEGEARVWKGRAYGPSILSLTFRMVRKVHELGLGLPIIAGGGIHHEAEARALLALGASAIELDTLLWIDPRQANALLAALAQP